MKQVTGTGVKYSKSDIWTNESPIVNNLSLNNTCMCS